MSDAADQSPQAMSEVLEDLHLHQIELELQNHELRRTHAELEAAQERYFDFYNLAPVGYLTVSEQALILKANLTAATLLGPPRSLLIGKALPAFMPSPDADRYYLLGKQAFASGSAQSCELRLVKAGEAEAWISLQAIAATGDDGAPALRIVLSDITARKHAEALALANEQFRNAILDSVPSQIAVLNQAGTIVAVNEAWRKFALDNGAPPANTHIGVNYLDLCRAASGSPSSDDAALARDGIMRVIDGTVPIFQFVYPCHSPTQHRWFAMAVTPLNADNHSVVVTHTDITESKQAERKLAQSASLLQEAQRIGRVGSWQWDVASGALYWSDVVYSIYRYVPKTSMPPNFEEHQKSYTHESAARLLEAVKKAFQSGESYEIELELMVDSSRPKRWVMGRGEVQRDDSGKITGLRGTVQDITENKQLRAAELAQAVNAEIALSNQQFRALVAFNTTAMENERKHIAREVHDELGQVLTALRMDLSLMGMRFGPLDPDLTEKIDVMKTLLDRAFQCVRNVATSLRPIALDMGLPVAIESLCTEFTRRNSIACAFSTQHDSIAMDESRGMEVYRIVQESLTNISRYAQASQVLVTLSCSGNTLGVEVRDNGRGFATAQVSQAKSFGLLGMRERAIALGGRAEIMSAPGQGTVIVVSVPIRMVKPGVTT